MNFVFQKEFNEYMDEDGKELWDICEDLDINFCPITIVPFVHDVVDDRQIKNLEGPTVCYGSNIMEEVSEKYGFKPGWFTVAHDEKYCRSVFRNNYINWDMVVCKSNDFDRHVNEFGYYFVKPVDQKYFPGTISDKAMLPFVIESQGDHYGTPEVYDICISTVKKIEAEWRFFVVGGVIVTGSKYHAENLKLDIQPGYDPAAKEFAEKMTWNLPYKDYVIDIARMKGGTYKVVELNQLNCSGFYAINKRDLLLALKDRLSYQASAQ